MVPRWRKEAEKGARLDLLPFEEQPTIQFRSCSVLFALAGRWFGNNVDQRMQWKLHSLGLVFIALFIGGCLTRHESEYFPDSVGRTFTILRPCYVYQYKLTTSVWFNTSRTIWWMEEKTEIDKIFAETKSKDVLDVYQIKRPVTTGAKFTIRKIQENIDLGGGGYTYAIGQLQFDGESLECAVSIAGPSSLIRTPWEPLTLPKYSPFPSRPEGAEAKGS